MAFTRLFLVALVLVCLSSIVAAVDEATKSCSLSCEDKYGDQDLSSALKTLKCLEEECENYWYNSFLEFHSFTLCK